LTTPLRIFACSVFLAFLAVLGVVVLLDRAAPVAVMVKPMPEGNMQVAISGAVATPGIVSVPRGARLSEVAQAAGGFSDTADFTKLNLAGRVGDGESITIPSVDEAAADHDSHTSAGTGTLDDLMDVNTATAQELEELPGIGEVLALRIVEYRTVNGPFSSVEELASVEGVSARMVEDLRPSVTVGNGG
jgi:competence protein ComEA